MKPFAKERLLLITLVCDVFEKANTLFVMLDFNFVYGECCMLLSGVCFFLFVM
jgi:hypothetical protein